MNGVKFGDKHSITDWDLLMTSKNIPDAEPKTSYIDIPAGDGQLDLTEVLGTVRYKNRPLSFTFDIFQDSDEWWDLRTKISNYVNGKKRKIILDQEPTHYFLGRCRILGFSNITTVATITIECNAEPYRYKLDKTVINLSVTNSYIGSLFNEGRFVIPEITTDSSISITINDITKNISAGTFKFADFMLSEGNNPISITGTANVTISYQEAIL